MTTTSNIHIVLDLCFLPARNRRWMRKTHQNQKPIRQNFPHTTYSRLLHLVTPLWMRDLHIQAMRRQHLPRLPPLETSSVLPSRGKDQKVVPQTLVDTFSHPLLSIGSRYLMVCLQAYNGPCTFSQKRTGGLLLSILSIAFIPHPPINLLTLSMLLPQGGLVHPLHVLR